MRDKPHIAFRRGAWRIYHLGGSEWDGEYATARSAVERVFDVFAQNWLTHHEVTWFRPIRKLTPLERVELEPGANIFSIIREKQRLRH